MRTGLIVFGLWLFLVAIGLRFFRVACRQQEQEDERDL